MSFKLISCGCVCPKLCLGEKSMAPLKCFGLECRCFIRVGLSMDSDGSSVVGSSMDVWMDFGVAMEAFFILKDLTGWCRKTALLFTKPMINTQSVVPSMDYCNEGLTREGCPSRGQEMARQGGGEFAQEPSFTRGVHQDAFFAPGGPLACRLRQCLSMAARDTLEALEAAAAASVRPKGRDVSIVWGKFISRTTH